MNENLSYNLRLKIIDTLSIAQRGHIGSSLSLVEIIINAYLELSKINNQNYKDENRNRIILSKGHGCLTLYAMLNYLKIISDDELNKFCKFNSILGGHPEISIPGVEASTGSLGHGMSIGVGMAIGCKIKKNKSKVIVITGDGELNEGSIWEALLSAQQNKLDNLYLFVDYNKIQSYGFLSDVIDLEPLKDKFKSFGSEVVEVNGHSLDELSKINFKDKSKPKVVICHTIKGKGIKDIENDPNWHHKSKIDQEMISLLKNNLYKF